MSPAKLSLFNSGTPEEPKLQIRVQWDSEGGVRGGAVEILPGTTAAGMADTFELLAKAIRRDLQKFAEVVK